METAHSLAMIDVTASLAELAAESVSIITILLCVNLYLTQGWCKPSVVNDPHLFAVEGGSHPVVSCQQKTSFVRNDCIMKDGSLLWVVTGPNMGGMLTFIASSCMLLCLGKSTFLRQNCLIIILGQVSECWFIVCDVLVSFRWVAMCQHSKLLLVSYCYHLVRTNPCYHLVHTNPCYHLVHTNPCYHLVHTNPCYHLVHTNPCYHLVHTNPCYHLVHTNPCYHLVHTNPCYHLVHTNPCYHLVHTNPCYHLVHTNPCYHLVHTNPCYHLVHTNPCTH